MGIPCDSVGKFGERPKKARGRGGGRPVERRDDVPLLARNERHASGEILHPVTWRTLREALLPHLKGVPFSQQGLHACHEDDRDGEAVWRWQRERCLFPRACRRPNLPHPTTFCEGRSFHFPTEWLAAPLQIFLLAHLKTVSDVVTGNVKR